MEKDNYFMNLALQQAKNAFALGEVPVGAVIVKNDQVIGSAYNLRESERNALAHAEILAIEQCCKTLQSWRLTDCDLYVTLEPCPMCSGAIINARIRRVIYGAYDSKAGCCESVINLFALPFNHQPIIHGGVLQKESSQLLKSFFKKLRGKAGN
ncbi:MAG: tRNA adenosine(34) deaminase TadA [Oscillospiraceae bacterium]